MLRRMLSVAEISSPSRSIWLASMLLAFAVAAIERYAELFPHRETDLASSCAVLPTDGDDLHKTAAFHVFFFLYHQSA